MEIEIKDEFFLETTCRTCTANGNNITFVPIFNTELSAEYLLFDVIEKFNLKITENDSLPQQICEYCLDSFLKLAAFQETCKKSQTILNKYFLQNLKSSNGINDIFEFLDIERLDTEVESSSDLKDEDETILKSDNEEISEILSVAPQNTHSEKNEDNILLKENEDIEEWRPKKKRRKLKNLPDDVEYKCDMCDATFKSKYSIRRHKKGAHIIGDFECNVCYMKFESELKFKYHLKSHDPNKKHKCKYCDKSYITHQHLLNHETTHTGIKPFKCNICERGYNTNFDLKVHLRSHTGMRPYICEICSKGFNHPGALKSHMCYHTGIKPYQCEFCGKHYVCKAALDSHLRSHTGDKKLNPSNELKKKYYNTAKSKESKLVYCCPICNKIFKLCTSLELHVKSHSEERNYPCTLCKSSFKRASHLQFHIDGVHLKKKPYACNYCEKTFLHSNDRNCHSRTHTGEKPYKCSECGLCFRVQRSLRMHEAIHTGERRYKCGICSKGFRAQTSLMAHTNKHSEVEIQQEKEKRVSRLKNIILNKA